MAGSDTIEPSTATALRRSAKRRLPKQLRKALADYVTFAALPPPEDAKGFAAHQAACKAALAHLDAGLKLLAWAENRSGPRQSGAEAELNDMIRAAEAAVERASPATTEDGSDV